MHTTQRHHLASALLALLRECRLSTCSRAGMLRLFKARKLHEHCCISWSSTVLAKGISRNKMSYEWKMGPIQHTFLRPMSSEWKSRSFHSGTFGNTRACATFTHRGSEKCVQEAQLALPVNAAHVDEPSRPTPRDALIRKVTNFGASDSSPSNPPSCHGGPTAAAAATRRRAAARSFHGGSAPD